MEGDGGDGVADRDRHRRDERAKERRDDRSKGRDRRDRGEREGSKERERRERDGDRRDPDGGKERERRDRDRRDRDGDRREREGSKERERRDRGPEVSKERERRRDKESDRQERERRREKENEREKDHDREKETGRQREKEGRSKDRDKSSQGHERDEKDRERAKDRDREREREREKDRTMQREKERERDRRKEKEKEKSFDGKGPDELNSKGRDGSAVGSIEVEMIDKEDVVAGDDSAPLSKGDDHLESNNNTAVQPSTAELRDRLAKLKEERLKGKSNGASEILSWVSKSRGLEERRNLEKAKTLRMSQALDEQENLKEESDDEGNDDTVARDHLAGVKILHGLDKVVEGGTVVLTLKDQDILAGGDVNEEVDMLENIEIGQQKQRDEAYKAAKKSGSYEDKFNNDMDSRKPVLQLYDDPEEEEGVTLDQSGLFSGEAEKKLEELRKRIQGVNVQKAYDDLSSTAKQTSDYYTSEEMLQFRKPKKKKKSLRKKDKLDYDALEAEAIAAGLGKDDLGSRNDLKRQIAREEKEKAEVAERSHAYQTAIAKAEEASKALQPMKLDTAKEEDDELVFGEDYEDLQMSLQQARKLALKRNEEASTSGPQAVALLASVKKANEDTVERDEEDQNGNKRVVMTEMEEFVWGLQFNRESRQPEANDVFMDEDRDPVDVEEIKADDNELTEVKESETSEIQDDDKKADTEPDNTIHELPYGKGLFFALSLAKERGTLNEGIEWGGRTTDKKKSKLAGIADGPRDVRIERVDEFGRVMTPKEAFRTLSHMFHGKNPGKMKQEKRIKKFQEDLKTKQMKASDTPLMSMERIRETQARTKTPYLVLSGHVKPGQTSDPASGFATVEKDHLGGLTPMLGDKKVEHFLGIKRSSEPGKMGPPPPKKHKT